MDLDEIKEIIESDGGKFIIVENGEPVLAIMDFNEYKEKLKGKASKKNAISAEPGEENTYEEPHLVQADDSEEIAKDVNIDDLPLE